MNKTIAKANAMERALTRPFMVVSLGEKSNDNILIQSLLSAVKLQLEFDIKKKRFAEIFTPVKAAISISDLIQNLKQGAKNHVKASYYPRLTNVLAKADTRLTGSADIKFTKAENKAAFIIGIGGELSD